jgi:hypothetical protein
VPEHKAARRYGGAPLAVLLMAPFLAQADATIGFFRESGEVEPADPGFRSLTIQLAE